MKLGLERQTRANFVKGLACHLTVFLAYSIGSTNSQVLISQYGRGRPTKKGLPFPGCGDVDERGLQEGPEKWLSLMEYEWN